MSSAKGFRFPILLLVAGVAAYFLFFSSKGEPTIPVVRTPQDFDRVSKEAQRLSESLVAKYDAGQALTEEEKRKLKQAAYDYEGMFGYEPERYPSTFLAGKIYYILENDEKAMFWLATCIQTPDLPGGDPDTYVQTLSEAHYLRSLVYFKQKHYKEASDEAALAVKYVPLSANYLVAQADAELQLGNLEAAKQLLQQALTLDPLNSKARPLAAFLGMEFVPIPERLKNRKKR